MLYNANQMSNQYLPCSLFRIVVLFEDIGLDDIDIELGEDDGKVNVSTDYWLGKVEVGIRYIWSLVFVGISDVIYISDLWENNRTDWLFVYLEMRYYNK